VALLELEIPTLSDAWLTQLQELSRALLGRDHQSGDNLVRAVHAVSQAYTEQRSELAALRGRGPLLSARLQFFVPRDLLKVHAPLAELASVDALPKPKEKTRGWRVLDLGAGLGSTSLGIARFAAVSGGADIHQLQVTAVDIDAHALALFDALSRDLSLLPGVPIQLTRLCQDLRAPRLFEGLRERGPFDVIAIGLALNELQGSLRADRQLASIISCSQLLSEDGCMIILEPALRETSRALLDVRAGLVQHAGPPYLFAPCLHSEACPMLPRERDYCHERVPYALPEPLASVATRAGLRDHDLTYSYLTLHRQARSLGELASRCARDTTLYRAVSGQLTSKGKREVLLCRPRSALRAMRLDRQRSADNAPFELAARGSILCMDGDALNGLDPMSPNVRVSQTTRITLPQVWKTQRRARDDADDA